MPIINIKSKILRWGAGAVIGFLVAICADHFIDGTRFSLSEVFSALGVTVLVFTILYLVNKEFEKAKKRKAAQ